MDALVRTVFDADVIDPEPFPGLWAGLFGQEVHRDPNGYPVGHCGMLEKLLDHMANLMP